MRNDSFFNDEQGEDQEQEEHQGNDEFNNNHSATRTYIENQIHKIVNAEGEIEAVFGSIAVTSINEGNISTTKETLYQQLPDQSIVKDREQLKKYKRCEVVVKVNGRETVCGIKSLAEQCYICQRVACRLHRKLIMQPAELSTELAEAMENAPAEVEKKMIKEKYICVNCLEQMEKQAKRAKLKSNFAKASGFLGRALTYIFRDNF
jgi:hypothetical protein